MVSSGLPPAWREALLLRVGCLTHGAIGRGPGQHVFHHPAGQCGLDHVDARGFQGSGAWVCKGSRARGSKLAQCHFYHILWPQDQPGFKGWENRRYLLPEELQSPTEKRSSYKGGVENSDRACNPSHYTLWFCFSSLLQG